VHSRAVKQGSHLGNSGVIIKESCAQIQNIDRTPTFDRYGRLHQCSASDSARQQAEYVACNVE
jgi:hypothetical protein